MTNGNGLRRTLKELQWSTLGPSRSDYEAYLREHRVLDEADTLEIRPDLSEPVYRDWQRRPQVACVFARRIAIQPGKFNVTTVVVPENPAEQMTRVIDATAEAVMAARGSSEALTVLLPQLVDSNLLVAFCKRLPTLEAAAERLRGISP